LRRPARCATFGLISLSDLCKGEAPAQEPWKTLQTQAALEAKDENAAIQSLQAVVETGAAESRVTFAA
jgi:hypothetical protein